MNNVVFFFAVVSLSFGLTWLLRIYALSQNVLDIPNARSSHSSPTPRGGGVAIVLALAGALLAAFELGYVSGFMLISLVGAGGLIAVVGFLDDHGHIAARWRLLAHFAGSGLGLIFVGGLAPITIGTIILEPTILRNALALLYLVWMTNLYNFMDGIDGLASVEAVTTCSGMCFLYALSGHHELIITPLLLAASALGFLIWNFPPAKIFMGDAGSGFLGVSIGILAVHSAWAKAEFFWAWCILLGVFIVDATYTLIRRYSLGAKVYEAHRSHAYQFASRKAGAHFPVTAAVGVINICWLLPIAGAVVMLGMDGVVGVIVAYLPLLFLAHRYRAGTEEAAS